MIDKIAVIGGGPGGLSACYELQKKGFTNIVAFEGRSKLGGIWSDNPGEFDTNKKYIDAFSELKNLNLKEFPQVDTDHLFHWNSPLITGELTERLDKENNGNEYTIDDPLIIDKRDRSCQESLFYNNKTGIYKGFYSNVSRELMRFTTDVNPESFYKGDIIDNKDINPLIYLKEIQQNIETFIEKDDIKKYYRFNSSVEMIQPNDTHQWKLYIRELCSDENATVEKWYTETFDAVVIANGWCQLPYIPFYMSGDWHEIHEYNKKFPGKMFHVRDIDFWEQNVLPAMSKNNDTNRKLNILIIGKSFSAMDVLKRVKEFSLEEKRDVNVYLSYNKAPELDDTGQNPFYWFDEWLLTAQKEGKIHLKPKIEKFVCTEQENGVKFIGDDDLYGDWDSIVFATGYLRSFPFLAPIIRQNYKIFMSPDPRTKHTSNISRVTGLYLHTFSIADPTLAFVGISSNANFQSFQLSAKTISDVWHKFNKLFNNPEITKDPPYYDNIWYNILPSINDQLEWSRKVLALKGNSGAFHFMYPFDVLQEYWLNDCEKLFESDFEQPLFPENTQTLYKYSVGRLKEIFLQTMNR